MNKEINKCLDGFCLYQDKSLIKSQSFFSLFSYAKPLQCKSKYDELMQKINYDLQNIDQLNSICQDFSNLDDVQIQDYYFEDNISQTQYRKNSLNSFSSEISKKSNQLYSQQPQLEQLKLQMNSFSSNELSYSPKQFENQQIDTSNKLNNLFENKKNKTPQLFNEIQEGYVSLRDRIEAKLKQKQKPVSQNKQQAIRNLYSQTTTTSSRYHSKSPQSKFTKQFEEKFQSISPSFPLKQQKKQIINDKAENLINLEQSNKKIKSNHCKTYQSECNLQIQIDIKGFQKKYEQGFSSSRITTPKKLQKINSKDFTIITQKKNESNNKSKSPNNKSANKNSNIITSNQCKHIVINLYSKK